MISTDQMQSLLDNGGVVIDSDGDKVGKIGQVYLDDRSGNPEWVTTKTGMFGGSETFVPLSGADATDEEIRVPYDKATIKDAPRVDDAEGHLSPEQEDELYRHYGLSEDSGTDGDGDLASGHRDHDDHNDHDGDVRDGDHDGDVRDGDHDRDHGDKDRSDSEGMVLSEERVDVGTEKVQTGKGRLRKYVVTEDVTTTVPVEREEVRLEREPISDDEAARGDLVADGELGEGESEVVLTEERVKVDKETVPVERVSLDTETVTDEQKVTEEVRKEQVETDLPDGVEDDHDSTRDNHDSDSTRDNHDSDSTRDNH